MDNSFLSSTFWAQLHDLAWYKTLLVSCVGTDSSVYIQQANVRSKGCFPKRSASRAEIKRRIWSTSVLGASLLYLFFGSYRSLSRLLSPLTIQRPFQTGGPSPLPATSLWSLAMAKSHPTYCNAILILRVTLISNHFPVMLILTAFELDSVYPRSVGYFRSSADTSSSDSRCDSC